MFNGIVDFLTSLFMTLHGFIENMGITSEGAGYVLSIAIFTVAIKLILLPLNIKSTKSTAKMQEVQPELQRIQKKYANDPQKAQMEMNRVMKENGASYMGSCLPMLLPLPILFALYYVFKGIGDTVDTTVAFLWINDLFGMSQDGFGEILKNPLNAILPILSGLSTYLPSVLMSKATTQTESPINMGMMNIFMSGMMVFMSINFPPILVIYWVISGATQLVQTYFLQYLPFKKKQMENALKEVEIVEERVRKSTPKTKKKK